MAQVKSVDRATKKVYPVNESGTPLHNDGVDAEGFGIRIEDQKTFEFYFTSTGPETVRFRFCKQQRTLWVPFAYVDCPPAPIEVGRLSWRSDNDEIFVFAELRLDASRWQVIPASQDKASATPDADGDGLKLNWNEPQALAVRIRWEGL